MTAWTLTRKQLVFVAAYAALFPISSLIGGTIGKVALWVSFPFLPLAYPIAGLIAYAFGLVGVPAEYAWAVGTFLAILLQAWLVAVSWKASRERKRNLTLRSSGTPQKRGAP